MRLSNRMQETFQALPSTRVREDDFQGLSKEKATPENKKIKRGIISLWSCKPSMKNTHG